MLQRISNGIVSWQIKKNLLKDNQRSLYLYAYEVLLNQIINIVVAVVIAVILRAPMPVLVFLVSYIPLRSYCGGYHAKTNGVCTVVSAILIIITCLLEMYIVGTAALYLPIAGFLISGILIFIFAPVADNNKLLDEEETRRYRLKSRQLWLAEVIAGGIFWFVNSRICVVLAISHLLLSIMLVYGVLKNSKMGMKEL
ncbi:accessory gene regulator B family protein [Clostridium boliviensis]|uniref:Accessory gene regulator B family protein n=1 Tax=Clostridium boliviensis TaxID=318465 RepID=A0ABU4GMQ5_9CLOT|nr:accessory gene regulator B family protein [Clostridium boliviensis]MDW2798903.1 accessory gene regulator B family protein [Clostridium boliviensis]